MSSMLFQCKIRFPLSAFLTIKPPQTNDSKISVFYVSECVLFYLGLIPTNPGYLNITN